MKGSVKGRRMYLFRCDFSSCSESTEIWHAYSFCVKKCPCFFFKKAEKHGPNYTKIHPNPPPPPPLSPSPNIVGFRSLRTKTLCMCVFYAIGGGGEGRRGGGGQKGGGGLSRACLKPRFPACEKKTQGHFLTQKESACQISADSEQLENRTEICTCASVWWSPSNLSIGVNEASEIIMAVTEKCLGLIVWVWEGREVVPGLPV